MEKASRSPVDVVHIEIEDGVPPNRKAEARKSIVHALKTFDWTDKLTFVRINNVDSGFVEDDIEAISEGRPVAFLQGKCQGPEDIAYIDRLIGRAEKKHGIPEGTIKIASMVERARALLKIDEMAVASPRMIAFYMGPTDLSTEVGYRRTYKGLEMEVNWVRSRVVFAAHAHGLLAIDSPSVHYKDLEETYEQARWAYHVGFDAKSCISPRQLEPVNRAFSPTDEEIKWAREVMTGKDDAEKQGLSVWVMQGMMVDDAMIHRATMILKVADRYHI
jgi:citrate lyase beta subunit